MFGFVVSQCILIFLPFSQCACIEGETFDLAEEIGKDCF